MVAQVVLRLVEKNSKSQLLVRHGLDLIVTKLLRYFSRHLRPGNPGSSNLTKWQRILIAFPLTFRSVLVRQNTSSLQIEHLELLVFEQCFDEDLHVCLGFKDFCDVEMVFNPLLSLFEELVHDPCLAVLHAHESFVRLDKDRLDVGQGELLDLGQLDKQVLRHLFELEGVSVVDEAEQGFNIFLLLGLASTSFVCVRTIAI